MELARDKNKSQARYSNCRCAGITGARLEGSRAFAWNGRVPSHAGRDAGFFEGTANRCARITDAACCGALQQARANRGGWRLVPYDVLSASEADNPVCPTTLADTIVCVTSRPACFHTPTPSFPRRMCRRVFHLCTRRGQCGASLSRFAFWECRRRTKLPWERALCQVGRRTRFLNCERFERRYDARNDGFFASKRRRKCAQSNRVAASAVSVSALRRELPRSHKHRVCDAWNE